jgi:hypothetical protein
MATQGDFSKAMTNRSLRTIRTVRHSSSRSLSLTSIPCPVYRRLDGSDSVTDEGLQELEFLADAAAITPGQLSNILSELPEQTALQAPRSQPVVAAVSSPVSPPTFSPPTAQLANTSLDEKARLEQQYPTPAPPPAYAQAPPILSIASAMYAYTPTDAGDLALQPHDRVQVIEHMNNDCK